MLNRRTTAALTATALALALAGALSGINAPTRAAAAPRAGHLPPVTLDFTKADGTSGDVTDGFAAVKDSDGNVVGTEYNTCAKPTPDGTKMLCTGVLDINDIGQISHSTVFPVDPAADAKFTGVTTGGTLTYEGLTGAVKLTAKGGGKYEIESS
ncbi:hypothetical protein [Kitasatospora purpeofusca]|uniref:hypothetical protein n=1 Tax=Kitasatospora purpeofusca TaxID=67352 RepID=UPI0035DF0602